MERLREWNTKELAMDLLEKGLKPLAVEAARLPHNRVIGNELTPAAYRYWEITGKPPADDILSLLHNYREHPGRTRAFHDIGSAHQEWRHRVIYTAKKQ